MIYFFKHIIPLPFLPWHATTAGWQQASGLREVATILTSVFSHKVDIPRIRNDLVQPVRLPSHKKDKKKKNIYNKIASAGKIALKSVII